MRLDVIKHRRVSLKVPPMEDAANNIEGQASEKPPSNGLRERRKVHQTLRISFDPMESPSDWPLASPFSAGAEWRRRALDGHRAAEEVNRWISSGDVDLLESLVLAGRADLLLGADHRENFIFGHNRSKQFLAELPEYKARNREFA